METPGAEAALVVRQGEIAASNTSLEQRTRKFFFNLRKFYPPIRVAQGNTGDNSGHADRLSIKRQRSTG
jgi:hypothetical protein